MFLGASIGLTTSRRNGEGASLSGDSSLSEFAIDSEDVLLLSNIQRGNGVTEVPVTAVPTHPGATRTINGSADPDPVIVALSTGDNVITVLVTAEDGDTTSEYSVTVRRLTAGVQEITDLNFMGAALATNGAGVMISKAGGRVGFWADPGGTTQPDWSAFGVTEYVQVQIDSNNSHQSHVSSFGVAMSANGFTVVDGNNGSLLVTDPTASARQDAEFSPVLSSAGATVNVTQQGANPS